MIPNGANVTAHAHYNLQLEIFLAQASEADILPTLKHSLLSVGQLCDDDCTAIFSKDMCTIYNKQNEPVITGFHNHSTGLYEQSIPRNNTKTIHQANVILPTTNLQEHIKYLHQCAFSPTPRTWIQAVKKDHFKTWPGVTVEAIQRYLPKSKATTIGHLDQQQKNTQSTKSQKDDHDTMSSPSPLDKGLRTQALYAATICYNAPTGKLYTDLMGRFPVQSSRGHKYILVAYKFDSNSIHVKPLKSRHDNDTIKAYEEIYSKLTSRGLKPKLHWLDNEASTALKNFLKPHVISKLNLFLNSRDNWMTSTRILQTLQAQFQPFSKLPGMTHTTMNVLISPWQSSATNTLTLVTTQHYPNFWHTTIMRTWIPLTLQVQYQSLSKLPNIVPITLLQARLRKAIKPTLCLSHTHQILGSMLWKGLLHQQLL